MSRLQRTLCAAVRASLEGNTVQVPEGAAVLWKAFNDLALTRTHGSAGPHPISYQEIAAYSRLMRLPLEPHHVAILTEMDDVVLRHAAGARPPEGVTTLPPRSDQPITPEMFDAMVG
ncbi:MAG: hypothetical protein AAF968_15510 [Pseudomonadota bacterium]